MKSRNFLCVLLALCAAIGTANHPSLAQCQTESVKSEPQFQRAFTLPTSLRPDQMAFSSDGQQLFTLGFRLTEDYRVVESDFQVWDVASRRRLWNWRGQNAPLHDFAAHPNGKTVALASDTGVWIRDARNGNSIARLLHAKRVVFSRDGRYLATGSDNAKNKREKPTRVVLKLWDTHDWKLSKTFEVKMQHTFDGNPYSYWVTALDFSPDGERLVAAMADRILIDCDVKSGKANRTDYKTNFIEFAPDGQSVIIREEIVVTSESSNSSFTLANPKTWQAINSPRYSRNQEATTNGELIGINSIAYTPDSRSIAAVFGDGFLGIFETQSGQLEATLSPVGTATFNYPLAFSPDGKQLVSGAPKGGVQFWEKR